VRRVELVLESTVAVVVMQDQPSHVPVVITFMLKSVRVDHMQLVALMVVVDILMALLAVAVD